MRLVTRCAACLAALSAWATAPVQGQSAAPAPTTRADSLAASGDTAAALALLDTLVRHIPPNASAWHARGMLLWAQIREHEHEAALQSPQTIANLIAADSLLRTAVALAPDSGQFALDLGRFFLADNVVTVRFQALGEFDRAAEAAIRVGDHRLAAEALDEVGMVYWRRYENVAHRWMMRDGSREPNEDTFVVKRHYADKVVQDLGFPITDPGELDYTKAVLRFRHALEQDPTNRRAARHTFMTLAEQGRWEEMLAVSAGPLQADTSNPDPYLARVLAFHRLGHEADAQQALDSGLVRLPEKDRLRYTRLTRILRKDDSARVAAMTPAQQADFERVYWALADPLALTTANENRLEYLSRVIYAELRWTSEDFLLHGADSDRGQIYARYGPPLILGWGPNNGGVNTIAWYYDRLDMRFVFAAPPSYGTTWSMPAEVERSERPVSFLNVPLNRAMDTVRVQLARFRGTGDSTELAVTAELPVARMAQGIDLTRGSLDLTLTLYDASARRIVRDSSRELVDFAQPDSMRMHMWHAEVRAPQTVYRVEALLDQAMRPARGMGVVALPPARGFDLSDVLVANELTPRIGAAPERWTDVAVTPSIGDFHRGQKLALLWETYDLGEKDATNQYKVTVAMKVLSVDRSGSLKWTVLGGIGDLIGKSMKGDDAVTLTYSRQRAASPVSLDYLTLQLGEAPLGRYRLTVTVEDLVTGKSTSTSREVRIVP